MMHEMNPGAPEILVGRATRTPNGELIRKQFESQMLPTGQPDLVAARGVVRAAAYVREIVSGHYDKLPAKIKAQMSAEAFHTEQKLQVPKLAAFVAVRNFLRLQLADGGYGNQVATLYDPLQNRFDLFMSPSAKELIAQQASRQPVGYVHRVAIKELDQEPDLLEHDPPGPPYAVRSLVDVEVVDGYPVDQEVLTAYFGADLDAWQDPETSARAMADMEEIRNSGIITLSGGDDGQ